MNTKPGRRILCVDDEPDVLRSLKFNLRRHFDVETAQSGPAALKTIRESGPFPVVVTDMRMPEMDGAELAARIREEFPDILCIVLTGYASFEAAQKAVNAGGVFQFLTKPCPTPELIDVVNRAFDESERRSRDYDSKLAEMTEHLAKTEQLATLGAMAGAVGHELNNLVTVYGGLIEFARMRSERGLPPEPQDFEDLVNIFDRLKVHATNLLHLGKPDDAPTGEVDLSEIVESTLQLLETSGLTKRASIRVELPVRSPVVRASRIRVEQVLINLLKNAIDAAQDAGRVPSIRVAIDAGRDDGSVVACRVSDNGPGIEAQNIPKIFEPYFTTKPPARGTGLGLPVVKRILESSGGTIQVESTGAEGTVFKMEWPGSKERALQLAGVEDETA